MDWVKQIKVDNYILKIFVDIYSEESPRSDDNLGKMVCFHEYHNLLGDKHSINYRDFNSFGEIKEYLEKEEGAISIYPLYLYDHSDLSMSIRPFSCPWDSGQVGFIYTTLEKINEFFGTKELTDELRTKINDELLAEVETYDIYLRGEIYSYSLFQDDILIDHGNGFYGPDFKKNGLFESLDIEQDIKDKFLKEEE